MTDPQHRRLRELYDGVFERPLAEREAYLSAGCAGDAALRLRVDALLAATVSNEFLGGADPSPRQPGAADAGVDGLTSLLESAAIQEGPGARIGPYKLLQSIGEGGFGVVFMAEQERPVVRKVALKVIKLGMDTRQVVARFEQERQALALMDHPNIARVLDAGATDSGRPYFVMELVTGASIVEYCDVHMLSVDERLALFAQVCNAVQHAHSKGVIHRDIKPSNVLVATQDGRPLAKVIDFGIAKAIASKLTERTLFTEHQQVIGTLQYMSPEQAEGSLDIDTRTDVYSLGVLLYELLTGSTPFDKEKLRGVMLGEIQRFIREVEPPRPSTRLHESAARLASIAAQRRVEPRRLGVIVRGELDWIVMKALEKERARRYDTAASLADDVRRYLSGDAVVAAPASRVYLVRKFVRRHRGPVAAVGAVALALASGLAAFAWQARVAERERDRALVSGQAADEARQVADQERARAVAKEAKAATINQFLLDVLDAGNLRALGPDTTVFQAVSRASERADAALSSQPEAAAAVQRILAHTYVSLGRLDDAAPHIEATLTATSKVHGRVSREYAEALRNAHLYRFGRGELVEAEALARETLEIQRSLGGDDDELAIESEVMLANCLAAKQQFTDAETLLRGAVAARERLATLETEQGVVALNSLAVTLHRLGQLDEAEVLYRQSLALGERVNGVEHVDTLTARMNLGSMLHSRGKDAEAEPILVAMREAIPRVFGPDHLHSASSAFVLATFYRDLLRFDEALPLAQEAARVQMRADGGASWQSANIQQLVGHILVQLSRLDEAAEVYRRIQSAFDESQGADSTWALWNRFHLAGAYLSGYRFEESLAVWSPLIDDSQRALGAEHVITIYSQNQAANSRLKLERFEEAESLARAALEAGRRVEGLDSPSTHNTQRTLTAALVGRGRPEHLDEAEALARDSIERITRAFGPLHANVAAAQFALGTALAARSGFADGELDMRTAVENVRAALGPEHPVALTYVMLLARACVDAGRAAEVEELTRGAYEATKRVRGPEHLLTAQLALELGACELALRRFEGAETLLRAAQERVSAALPRGHGDQRRAALFLQQLYDAWNRAEPSLAHEVSADEWRDRVAEFDATWR